MEKPRRNQQHISLYADGMRKLLKYKCGNNMLQLLIMTRPVSARHYSTT